MELQVYLTNYYYLNKIGYFLLTHTTEYMSIVFFSFILLFIINLRTIIGFFSKIKKQTGLVLFFIFIIGFWLRNAEYRYGYGVDGYFYQETAKTLYEKDLYAKGCAIGNLDSCRLYHQHLFPAGYPYLITLMFHLFGEHDILAMYISGILSSLTIILVFCITYLLFSDERKGLYAAMVLTFFPMDIMISPTAAVRPTSNFFIALTILSYLIALKKDSIRLWSLFAVTFSYTAYVRQENLILILPIVLGLFLLGYFKKKHFINFNTIKSTVIPSFTKFSLLIVIFLTLSFPVSHWILFSNIAYGAGYGLPDFSFDFFKIKAPAILSNLFVPEVFTDSYLFNPIISLFFLSSIPFIFLDKENQGKILILWIIFLIFFIMYASFFDIGLSSDYIRTIQPLVIPYSILSGFCLLRLEKKVTLDKRIFLIVIFISLALFIRSESIKNSHKEFSFGARYHLSLFKDSRLNEFYTRAVVGAINKTSSDSLIFVSQAATPDFDLVRTKERRWIDIDLIYYNISITEKEIDDSIESGKSIFLLEDYRCKYERDEACNFIYDNFDFELFDSIDNIEIYSLKKKGKSFKTTV